VNESLLTARQVASHLGFSPSTIVDWAEAGTVPAFKIGGRLRFRLSEVEAWLEERRLRRPDAGRNVLANHPRPVEGRLRGLANRGRNDE
jgi:excisionase family DNA binding protein